MRVIKGGDAAVQMVASVVLAILIVVSQSYALMLREATADG